MHLYHKAVDGSGVDYDSIIIAEQYGGKIALRVDGSAVLQPALILQHGAVRYVEFAVILYQTADFVFGVVIII